MSIIQTFSGFRQTRMILKPTFAGESNSYVCSGSEDSDIYVWETETGEVKQILKGHTGSVNSVTWTDCNGGMLLSASDDKKLKIWTF